MSVGTLPFVDAWEAGTEEGKIEAADKRMADDVLGLAWNAGSSWLVEHASKINDKDRLALLVVFMNAYVNAYLSAREAITQ